jgi:hypothetical protein
MPTPPASGAPDDRTALEPVRVLRPRNTDALAQLLDEIRQDKNYRTHAAMTVPVPPPPSDAETAELPPVPGGRTETPAASDGSARPPRRAALVIAVAAAAVAGFGCSLLIPGPTEATQGAPSTAATPSARVSAAPSSVATSAADELTNSGFESGSVSPWNCAGQPGSLVASPVHAGAKALQGTVSSSDTGQCEQTVAVRPDTTYSLSGWVRGSNVYLGVDGSTSTWATSPAAYTRLTVSFTTGPTQTDATVYVHGWYAQGSYYADDITLK